MEVLRNQIMRQHLHFIKDLTEEETGRMVSIRKLRGDNPEVSAFKGYSGELGQI
jgi:hypothetical protein